ncbi:MAG: hypothetical protein ACI4GA_07655 [Acutalibacteraceae bacterium]|nr:hypothetical protein [Oscillospiraceae bacterium]
MFILLKIEEKEDSFKNRLRDRFFAPRLETERVEMKKAAPFFVMTCPKYRGIVPYNVIAAAAGRMKDKIVAPGFLDVPQEAAIKLFNGKKLKKQLLINTALRVLKGAGQDSGRISLTVIDETAAYLDKIEDFAGCAREITVLTKAPKEYERAAERLMENCGLSLIVRDENFFSGQNGIVVSDSAESVTPYFKGILFTNDNKFPLCSHNITGSGVRLSGYTDYAFPPEYDSVDIACAMYELCYAGGLGELHYENPSFDSAEMSFDEISRLCLNSGAACCK